MLVKDIRIQTGDLNKIARKENIRIVFQGSQMGHNVWSHINAVQEANRQYDAGIIPKMLVQEQFDRVLFRDVVEEIFSKTTKEESLEVIEKYSKFWISIPGTRGAVGKKTVNASTFFDALFDVDETTTVPDEEQLDETKLEELEDEQLHGST